MSLRKPAAAVYSGAITFFSNCHFYCCHFWKTRLTFEFLSVFPSANSHLVILSAKGNEKYLNFPPKKSTQLKLQIVWSEISFIDRPYNSMMIKYERTWHSPSHLSPPMLYAITPRCCFLLLLLHCHCDFIAWAFHCRNVHLVLAFFNGMFQSCLSKR